MRKTKFISFGVIALVLVTLISTFTYVINNYKSQNKNTVISLQNVLSQGESNCTIDDYKKLIKKYEDLSDTAFCSELTCETVKDITVTPVLINHNYLKYNNISYTNQGITEEMEENQSKTAVISQTFADEISDGKSAIGKTFKLNDERYRVTGVYDDKSGTINDFFKDNKERIYINYTSVDNYEKEKLSAVSCIDGTNARKQFYFLGFDNFERVDFDEKNMVVNDFTSIISFILTIIISVYLIRLWINNIGATYRFIKTKHNETYLKKLLTSNLPSLITRLLIFLVIPIIIGLLCYISFKDFHIIYSYIDKENLFSLSHMFNALATTLQNESVTLMGGNPYFINLYNGTLILGIIFIAVILSWFFFTYYTFNQISKESKVAMYFTTTIFALITLISLIVCLVSKESFTFLQLIFFVTAVFISKSLKEYFIKKS